ncbi:MAG: hypothetical protein ACLGSD_17330 [Acidobacteriota bacterium]
MNGKVDLSSRGRSSKEGRPSNLALYRPCWCPEASITTLKDAPLDCAEWFQSYGGYIFRTFSTGEDTGLFDISETMRAYIRGRLEQSQIRPRKPEDANGAEDIQARSEDDASICPHARLARWFEPPENPSLKLAVPPLHLSSDAWDHAVSLAQKLMSVAQHKPYLVRSVVLGYCYAATTHRHVVITGAQDAEYGNMLFKLVEELHVEGLAIRYVGYRAGTRQTDVAALVEAFGLPAAPHDYETANNLGSPARLNHIGIRVCWGDSHRASPEWHQVAVLAAVTELWRCVSPKNGFQTIP